MQKAYLPLRPFVGKKREVSVQGGIEAQESSEGTSMALNESLSEGKEGPIASSKGCLALKVGNFDGLMLIESDQGAELINHLNIGFDLPVSQNLSLRGIFREGDEALFELFDAFGQVWNEPLRVPEDVVRARILDAMIWSVWEG